MNRSAIPRRLLFTSCLLFGSAFILPPSAFSQGSLTPPGAPGPTMKRLDEIEPRINLQATPPPAGVDTADTNYHFIITQPGSYYLSANLVVSRTNGILIKTEGVTIDLRGFKISRSGVTTGGDAIQVSPSSHRASVRDGSIRGFAYGVESLAAAGSGNLVRGSAFRNLAVSGCTSAGIMAGDSAVLESCRVIDTDTGGAGSGIVSGAQSTLVNCMVTFITGVDGISVGRGSSLSHCTASKVTGTHAIMAGDGSSLSNCSAYDNAATGIYANHGCVLHNCSSHNNTGDFGIFAGIGSSLTNCSAYLNTVGFGISANFGSTLTHCSAVSNTSTAAGSGGILTGGACTVTHCSSYSNNSTAGTSTASTGQGFNLDSGSTIQNCTAYSNQGDGIRVNIGCTVRQNNCRFNGNIFDGAGIHSTNTDNRIEGNNVTNSTRGIDVDSTGSFIVKNSVSGSTTNYEIAANNKVGTIVSAPNSVAISGSTGGAGVGSTDPWANVSY